MRLEFDADKDRINREKHGVSLAAAIEMDLDSAMIVEDSRFNYGERRLVAFGGIDGRLHCLVFSRPEPNVTRAISLRKANAREVRRYG
jgi:uncharacterized protein